MKKFRFYSISNVCVPPFQSEGEFVHSGVTDFTSLFFSRHTDLSLLCQVEQCNIEREQNMDTVAGFGPRLRHPVMRRFVMRCGLPYYLYVTNAMEKSQSWSNVTDKDVVFGLLLLLLF